MTIQQTPAKVAANKILAGFNARADAAAGTAPAKPARRLPVQKDWPT
ncbi:MAG TPA: hypothetical protein VNW05_01965 [Steroidobacteraceae bacterium]|nr:hypothetical protein [Steroidobacteraceae bacterium]